MEEFSPAQLPQSDAIGRNLRATGPVGEFAREHIENTVKHLAHTLWLPSDFCLEPLM